MALQDLGCKMLVREMKPKWERNVHSTDEEEEEREKERELSSCTLRRVFERGAIEPFLDVSRKEIRRSRFWWWRINPKTCGHDGEVEKHLDMVSITVASLSSSDEE